MPNVHSEEVEWTFWHSFRATYFIPSYCQQIINHLLHPCKENILTKKWKT